MSISSQCGLGESNILVVNTKTSNDRCVSMTMRLKNLFASFEKGKPNKLVFANVNGERHQQVPNLRTQRLVDEWEKQTGNSSKDVEEHYKQKPGSKPTWIKDELGKTEYYEKITLYCKP